ncbi:hypothetical protein AAF463_11385 [Pantoea sp. BJ2]|uniref:Uncharacterized protein n=1 Tax=Pantoea sp. BJ2 TaxID=3141322 RepID=A0AAU7TRC7_9GAMM
MAKKADETEDNTPEVITDGSEVTTATNAEAGAGVQNASSVAFVTMVRDSEVHPAPHTAQVHPEEVKNYYSGGWAVKQEEAE